MAKVGISFVSAAGAAANLAAEDPGWNFRTVSGAATAEWNGLLGRVAVQGGTETAQRTFYTALYHSLLFPSVFSDDDGQYMGFDHRVHTLAPGHVQYSNFSECDIYRSEVPLLATLLPGPTSQMVQSLSNDAAQTKGGFLPKWVIADNDAGQWDGDSADPIIADAYAYGARQFNVKEALKAMIHGATVPESGFVERAPEPAEVRGAGLGARAHLRRHLVSVHRRRIGDPRVLDRRLLDLPARPRRPATRPRRQCSPSGARTGRTCSIRRPGTWPPAQADGSFPSGPAFQPASPADQAQGVAQQGFEEGNAIQYTWAVPQNLAGLIGLMGGDRAAVAKLNTFFTQLNATRFKPYRLGRERAGRVDPLRLRLRRGAVENPVGRAPHHDPALLRSPRPHEPGEDDLGALSSWYVWAALGLYPETPGVANLAMTSPLFPQVRHRRGKRPHAHHHRLARSPTSTSRMPVWPSDRAGLRPGTSRGSRPRPCPRERPSRSTWEHLPTRRGGRLRRPPPLRSRRVPPQRWPSPPRADPSPCPPTDRPPSSSASRRHRGRRARSTRSPGMWFPRAGSTG